MSGVNGPMPGRARPGSGVLVVGDANPDLILGGDTVPRFGQVEQLLDSAELVLGGSAAIVAAGLARLDVPTALVAVIGDDDFGRFVRARLEERGVDTSAVIVDTAMATGISVILVTTGDRAILTLPGSIPVLRAAHVRSAVERLRPRHVHLASFFLLPALAGELPGLLAWLGARGLSTSIDTNWDPSERWAGLGDVVTRVDLVLPNRDEVIAIARAVTGSGADDAIRAAQRLAALGPRVVVKSGADGGVCVEPDGTVTRAPGLAVDVVDTTGAGDSFDAGYLAAYLSGALDAPTSVADQVRRAAVAGSLSTRAAGGTAAQATAVEVGAALA